MKKLDKYSSKELIHIAVLAAIGLAIKPIVTPLVHIVSTPLMLPGGSLAGGFYMMWLVLAAMIISHKGAAFLTGFIQAVVVLSLGYFGNHGAVSLISYSLPGLSIEIIGFLFKRKDTKMFALISCVTANITGTLIVSYLVMRLAFIPLIISVLTATISGIVGGMLSFDIYKKLKKYELVRG